MKQLLSQEKLKTAFQIEKPRGLGIFVLKALRLEFIFPLECERLCNLGSRPATQAADVNMHKCVLRAQVNRHIRETPPNEMCI